MPFDIGNIRYFIFPILSLYLLWDFKRKTKDWKRENVRKLLIGISIFIIIVALVTTYGLPHLYKNIPESDLGSYSTSIPKLNLFELPSIFILLVCLEVSRRWLIENKGYSMMKATLVAIVPYTIFYYFLGRIL